MKPDGACTMSFIKCLILTGFMFCCCVADAQQVVLDTKFVKADGNEVSLYEEHEAGVRRGQFISKTGPQETITFYVKVEDLFGAEEMKASAEYKLDSFSWIGHKRGWFSGYRNVIISLGRDRVKGTLPDLNNEYFEAKHLKGKKPLLFKKGDLLKVRIVHPGVKGDGSMGYFDTLDNEARISGTAMNLCKNHQLPSGNKNDNKYNKEWRFNCPAVRICATEVEKDKSLLYYAAGVITGVVGMGILMLLVGLSRKKKRSAAS